MDKEQFVDEVKQLDAIDEDENLFAGASSDFNQVATPNLLFLDPQGFLKDSRDGRHTHPAVAVVKGDVPPRTRCGDARSRRRRGIGVADACLVAASVKHTRFLQGHRGRPAFSGPAHSAAEHKP